MYLFNGIVIDEVILTEAVLNCLKNTEKWKKKKKNLKLFVCKSDKNFKQTGPNSLPFLWPQRLEGKTHLSPLLSRSKQLTDLISSQLLHYFWQGNYYFSVFASFQSVSQSWMTWINWMKKLLMQPTKLLLPKLGEVVKTKKKKPSKKKPTKKKKGNYSELSCGDFSVCSGESFTTGSHNQVWDPEQGEGFAWLLWKVLTFWNLK